MIGFLCHIIIASSLCIAQHENPKNSPLSTLGIIDEYKPTIIDSELVFSKEWVDSLRLILPCDNIQVPKRTMRLPNAPRSYRNGTHRGVDFFANWGTPVKSVADGVIVRSDQNYEEVPASFRESLLKASSKVGNTPSDIFNNILLGKSVFIDHGFDLVNGFRCITIYAHLSSIAKEMKPGTKVSGGDVIGQSGNTGMRESTLGSRSGSHLHWELILQKGKEEIYLGQGMSNPDLYNMLKEVFK